MFPPNATSKIYAYLVAAAMPGNKVRSYLLDELVAVEPRAQAFIFVEDSVFDLAQGTFTSALHKSMVPCGERGPLKRSAREEFVRYDEAAIANYNRQAT
jgi:hypothetical protein